VRESCARRGLSGSYGVGVGASALGSGSGSSSARVARALNVLIPEGLPDTAFGTLYLRRGTNDSSSHEHVPVSRARNASALAKSTRSLTPALSRVYGWPEYRVGALLRPASGTRRAFAATRDLPYRLVQWVSLERFLSVDI